MLGRVVASANETRGIVVARNERDGGKVPMTLLNALFKKRITGIGVKGAE